MARSHNCADQDVVTYEVAKVLISEKVIKSHCKNCDYLRTSTSYANTDATLTLSMLQVEQAEWAKRNFGEVSWNLAILGVMEELGELAHALLKQEQGIRGDWQDHEEKARDAVGDLLIYLANVCTSRGWNMQRILEETWEHVRTRDWKANPAKGLPTT